ncbi:MAG: hypothetical protein HOP28_04200 [Gemmatimonadales bacterium]|nr:hypothetical protein [Gemmatimonadales bacterium]
MRLLLTAQLLLALPLAAQAPGTDIFVARLSRSGGVLKVDSAVNITARPGYDNQPGWSADAKSVYFTSQRAGQTDIYRYDLASKTTAQVTDTPESEYSATVMPDGRHVSVIRVERDSSQRLWAFTLDGLPAKPVLDTLKPIGYHAWLNADTVFVFVLGSPATLRRAELGYGTSVVLASDIGRGLAKVPNGRAIAFVQRDSAGGAIRTVDPVSGRTETLVRLPQGNEFFAWMPDGTLLSATGNRLLSWRAGQTAWTDVATFDLPGLQRISRLAVSRDGSMIALVGEEPAPPR